MWFKKKSVLQADGHYNSNTAYDGTDWRTTNKYQTWSVSQTLPSAADAGNYFYLPTLGSYDSGKLNYVGLFGYYWSSSADSHYIRYAYTLYFHYSEVLVDVNFRYEGFRVDGFE